MSAGGPNRWARWSPQTLLVGALVVVALSAAAAALVIVPSSDDDAEPPEVASTPLATATAAPPRLLVAGDLRSAASERVAIVERLPAGTPLLVDGIDSSGNCLSVAPLDRPTVRGWLPVDAVGGIEDLDALQVLAAPPIPSLPPTAATAADAPDLAVVSILSVDNRLAVTLANLGTADVTGTILLAFNEGEAAPIDVKAGEPLIAGDEVELVLEGEFVQRRGRVIVEASIDPPAVEVDASNNRRSTVIEPDRPNDIAIVNALLVEGEGLVVSVRNNSPIPIVGRITVDVREVATNALVGRMREGVELLPEAELAVTFEQITELDFTRHTVQLFSDALDDSDLTNNIFPR